MILLHESGRAEFPPTGVFGQPAAPVAWRAMRQSRSGLTTFVLRRRRWIVVAWLIVTVAGFASLGSTTKRLSTETLLGGIGALAVLAFVFGSFIAFVPLLMAVIAIPTTFLIVGGMTHITSVSVIAQYLIALIGLGVAIDYSLLVVTRWREERANGHDNHQAVVGAMNSAGRAVVFSGLTVGVSLLALVVLPVSFLRSIGVAAFLIPIVSIAVALTLLPALLAGAGPFLDRPRLRREVHASRPWTAWAQRVLRHRIGATVVGAGILIALIVPVFAITLGEPKTSALAQTGPAHATLDGLEAGGVPSGILEPMDVLVQDGRGPAVAARLGKVKGVYAAGAPNSPE